MSSKTRYSPLKYPRALFLVVALAGFAYISFLASDPSVSKGGGGVKVGTMTQPSIGTIAAPGSPNEIAGQPAAPVVPAPEEVSNNEAPQGGFVGKESCEHLLLLVDSDHALSPDYVPPDLVYLSYYGIMSRGTDAMLREEAALQLGSLLSAAAGDGVEILVASGYRSYWVQEGTFAWFKEAYGEEAGRLSVPPGQSEHQLGTAVDFTSSNVDYELLPAFEQTTAGMWLAEHAAEYGFVLSYAEEQAQETGVRYEPWHYRYVGVESALEVEASGGVVTPSIYREGMPHCYKS